MHRVARMCELRWACQIFFVLLECVNKRFLRKLFIFFLGNLFFRTLDGLVGGFSYSAAEHSSSGFVRKRKNAHGGMTFILHDESQNLSFMKKRTRTWLFSVSAQNRR